MIETLRHGDYELEQIYKDLQQGYTQYIIIGHEV